MPEQFFIDRNNQDHKYTIFGELHGARENVGLMEKVLAVFKTRSERKISFAFEWELTETENARINSYVVGEAGEDEEFRRIIAKLYLQDSGVFSDQHLEFIRLLKKVNQERTGEPFTLIGFDNHEEDWNVRDKQMADRLMNDSEKQDNVFAITSNLHARKVPFELDKKYTGGEPIGTYVPFASHTPEDDTTTVLLQYNGGKIFNFGTKELSATDSSDDLVGSFDQVYSIGPATPMTFEQKTLFS